MIKNDETEAGGIVEEKSGADRICIVEEDKGPVVLQLYATNSLQVDADVHLVPADNGDTTLESVRLDTRYLSEVPFETAPFVLNNRRALVRFAAWSVHPDFYNGKISLVILQNNRHCILSKPAEWLRIVPRYGSGQAFEWTTVIHFFCTPAKKVQAVCTAGSENQGEA